MRVAFPTNKPGGLDAQRSDHFGHCDVFTLIDFDEKKNVGSVTTVANGGHEAGGCMEPVKKLQDAGAEAIVVGGMGARPMQGFVAAGITVYYADPAGVRSVREAVEKFVANGLPVMHGDQVCKGSGNCQH